MKKRETTRISQIIFSVLTLILFYNCKKDDTLQHMSVSDIDGNSYDTITIGTQTWMTENLKTTRLNDNASIQLITDNEIWGQLTEPGYCWYKNDAANFKDSYGALYNWYAVSTGKLCPAGWHVPSDEEFKTLEKYLGMTQAEADALSWHGTDQGTQMKTESGWNNGGNGTNANGFSGLPGGYRNSYGIFDSIGSNGYWWSSTVYTEYYNSWMRYLAYYESRVNRMYGYKSNGFSVRCLKD